MWDQDPPPANVSLDVLTANPMWLRDAAAQFHLFVKLLQDGDLAAPGRPALERLVAAVDVLHR